MSPLPMCGFDDDQNIKQKSLVCGSFQGFKFNSKRSQRSQGPYMEVFLKNEDYHIFLFAQMGFCAMPAAIDTPSRD